MAEVAYPFGEPPEVSQVQIVRVLETALERARAGLVRGVFVASVETSGFPAAAWHFENARGLDLIGAGAIALDRLRKDAYPL